MKLRETARPVAHAIRSVLGTHGMDHRLAMIEAAVRSRSEVPAVPAPTPNPVQTAAFPDANMMLHQCRGALLRGMPAGAQRLLSAGCAGAWYFDWIEQTYGRVPEHLGIEYYSPEPPELPNNVRWIANTASDMSGVEAESCDLVFSGQNLEHLWPEEVSGFLLEAARVLRPGGHLVIDSPNRLITAALNWSHPEHTLELTAEEMTGLLALSGFDVTAQRGIWLCRDPRSGEILPFLPSVETPGWTPVERMLVAGDDPVNSFIWWIEAQRAERAPDAEAVRETMTRLFAAHWPERVQRFTVATNVPLRADAEGTWVECGPSVHGAVVFGPYMALRAGHYEASWRFRRDPAARPGAVTCEVVVDADNRIVARGEAGPGATDVSVGFSLPCTTFGVQFRCIATGGESFSVLRRIELVEGAAPAR